MEAGERMLFFPFKASSRGSCLMVVFSVSNVGFQIQNVIMRIFAWLYPHNFYGDGYIERDGQFQSSKNFIYNQRQESCTSLSR